MEENLKQLLLRDLSARLPYEVKVKITNIEQNERTVNLNYGNIYYVFELEKGWWVECKPYLRPMSSMTEEEKTFYEYHKEMRCFAGFAYTLVDWLNEHHFDYRGLIEKGLALEAKEGMYGENK